MSWDDIGPDGLRRYGRHAGSPGMKEDITRCIVSVSPKERYGSFFQHQCNRKRGKGPDGLYCGIHAKQRERLDKIFSK